MIQKYPHLLALLTCIVVSLTAAQARAQSPTASCKNGVVASASLSITLTKISPPTEAGLIVRVFPAAQEFHEGQDDYRLMGSGQTAEFAGLCTGKYVVLVHGNGPGLCGYVARRTVSLRNKENRQLKLVVNWKKGSLCE